MSSSEETSPSVYHGRVKWFNNKAGYGFITITNVDGPATNDMVATDIFAHHSAICVSEEQYKYLVQGEYVEFVLLEVESGKDYKYQSSKICGVHGGKLLCETRNASRNLRPPRRNQSSNNEKPKLMRNKTQTNETISDNQESSELNM